MTYAKNKLATLHPSPMDEDLLDEAWLAEERGEPIPLALLTLDEIVDLICVEGRFPSGRPVKDVH